MAMWKTRLPDWLQEWLEIIVPGTQILVILIAAWLLQRLLVRVMDRVNGRYQLPTELLAPLSAVLRWAILAAAVLLVLERLGVSATVLWTAFTGFATVAAVAFFAAWSVLSNLFCALLILTVRPYRIGDVVEVLDTAEKPGAKGLVVDINLLYTTLQDMGIPGTPMLQIPNALIFQRVVRRWPSPEAAGMANAATPAASETAGPGGGPDAAAAAPTATTSPAVAAPVGGGPALPADSPTPPPRG
ncbi:mechanosensitive ion channel family protein [Acidovorax lacteus]|uniref:Small-conductance mechanosensitive channel n=1 Tax=Acidovorax lacteus TaxID=1924988 RepID=A0ABP8LG64_9BURK